MKKLLSKKMMILFLTVLLINLFVVNYVYSHQQGEVVNYYCYCEGYIMSQKNCASSYCEAEDHIGHGDAECTSGDWAYCTTQMEGQNPFTEHMECDYSWRYVQMWCPEVPEFK